MTYDYNSMTYDYNSQTYFSNSKIYYNIRVQKEVSPYFFDPHIFIVNVKPIKKVFDFL